MPHVVDFLVLKHIFEESLLHNWKEGILLTYLLYEIFVNFLILNLLKQFFF